jgi:hypothetical protein
LATVTIKGKDKGASSLTFVGAKLADPDGQEIPSQSVDGQVEIAATAAPGGMNSSLLIGTGAAVGLAIAVVAFLVLRKRK